MSQNHLRTIKTLQNDWKFTLEPLPSTAYFKDYDDASWESIQVPHDWSVHSPFSQDYSSGTGYLCGGEGFYRCHFQIAKGDLGKHFELAFCGVYKNAKVWFNSNYLGKHHNGYTSFSYDISEFVTEGDNVISLTCEHHDLADSRWFTGNGIYRDVILTITDPIFIEDVFIYTMNATEKEATMGIQYDIPENCTYTAKVLYNGVEVPSSYADGTLKIENPQLWDCESPNLYQLTSCLLKDGTLIDSMNTTFGIRTFYFDSNTGFFLNNTNMKLKGLCMHHDAGVLGAAVPKEVWRNRFEKFKACGCNAIRCSHNPPDPHFLDLCDEMGFLVMNEAFDEWEGCKNKWWQGHNVYPPKHYGYYEDFPECHEKDLSDLIIRDRNHPSIILWSIGNEVDYPNDPYVHPYFETMTGNNDANKPAAERVYNPNKPNAQRLQEISKQLVSIVKTHDTTRPVISALAFPELSNIIGYAQTLDVVGYNYKEHLYEEDHKKYPDRILLGSENGTRAETWSWVKNNDYISGQFLWTGIDFLGEALGWPIRISQAGLLTLAAQEKANYYRRKMLWTEELSIKLATSTTNSFRDESFSWNYNDSENIFVSAYTNGNEVELFLNGVSLGKKAVTEEDLCRVTWEVPYEPGNITAVSYCNDATVEDCITTACLPTQINFTNMSKPEDSVKQIVITILDDNSNPVVHHDVDLCYTSDFGLLGIESGCPNDLVSYTSTVRKTYKGKSIAYVATNHSPCTLTVHFATDPNTVFTVNI